MGDFIGKIAKGYKADLVLLDLDHVIFVPLNNAGGYAESDGPFRPLRPHSPYDLEPRRPMA